MDHTQFAVHFYRLYSCSTQAPAETHVYMGSELREVLPAFVVEKMSRLIVGETKDFVVRQAGLLAVVPAPWWGAVRVHRIS